MYACRIRTTVYLGTWYRTHIQGYCLRGCEEFSQAHNPRRELSSLVPALSPTYTIAVLATTMAPTWDLQHDLTPSNFQSQCPLFGRLPGEIRNDIFSLVLVQYEDQDEGKAYPVDSYWYRPGFRGPRRSSSALLRTCKLAYAEGQKVFLRELEWAFWFSTSVSTPGRGAFGARPNLTYIRRPWPRRPFHEHRMPLLLPKTHTRPGSASRKSALLYANVLVGRRA